MVKISLLSCLWMLMMAAMGYETPPDDMGIMHEVDVAHGGHALPKAVRYPLQAQWRENLAVSSSHYFEELALLELNMLATRDDIESISSNELPLVFTFTMLLYGDEDDLNKLYQQLQTYMVAIRINRASRTAFEPLWQQSGRVEHDSDMLSLDSELRMLKILIDRLQDFRSMDATELDREYRDVAFQQWQYAFKNISSLLQTLPSNHIELCKLDESTRMLWLGSLWEERMAAVLHEAGRLADAVNQRLIQPILSSYLHDTLEPYVAYAYCPEMALNQSLHNHTILASALVDFSNSNHTVTASGMFVVDRAMEPLDFDLFLELDFAERFLDVDMERMEDPLTVCGMHLRYLYR